MKQKIKIFSNLFVFIIIVLIVASIITLYSIHYKLFFEKHSVLSFYPEGINEYFSAYQNHKSLLASTVATIAAYLGLLRLEVAADANIEKLKQDRFIEWKSILEIRFLEIDEKNPFMKREFIKERNNYFNLLYDQNFIISDEKSLIKIFDKTFKKLIDFFEISNLNYISRSGHYKDDKSLYAFESFQFLFIGCTEEHYSEILSDLEKIYLKSINPNRIIGLAGYAIAGMKLINK